MSIYVRDAAGNRHKIAGVGLPGPAGKSAYQYAVEGGFSGTEEEFRAVVGVRSNPNLLDNWYFADPINQRGQTEYTENEQYTIDRWYLRGTISQQLTVSSNGLRACLKSSNEDGNECKIENLSRNEEFPLTIFPESAEFVEPTEKTLYHPAARQHNKLV